MLLGATKARQQRRIGDAPAQEAAAKVAKVAPHPFRGRSGGLPEGAADQKNLLCGAVAAVRLQDDLALAAGGANRAREQVQERAQAADQLADHGEPWAWPSTPAFASASISASV